MTKKSKLWLSALILLLIIFVVIYLRFNQDQTLFKSGCVNKKYQIALTLLSGEKGTVSLADNQCDLNLAQLKSDLSFKVLSDGAIEESIYKSKLYIWSRNANLSIEEQIKSLAKNKSCLVEKNKYPQRDGLTTYAFNKDSKATGDCMLFGIASDFASEVFMANNNLLILQRQEGLDGIEPFNLATIKFAEE